MTVIRPNSISGINSITAQGGDLNLFRADGAKADIPTVNNITAGVVTATKFVGSIEATTGTFTGNLGVAGVLTYEDVTNVDSVGVITARNGGYLDIRTGSSINTNVTGGSASGTLHKNTNSGEFAVVSGGTGGNNYLSFYTSASAAPTEKLRIASDGNVHINCPDNGTANAKLNIEDSTNNSTNTLKLINKPSGANGKARLEFYTETSSGQGCSPYIMSTSGTDAFGSNSSNDGGFEFHTKYGGSGTDATAMKISNQGYVLKPTTPAFSTNAQTSGFSANSTNFLTPSARINNGNYYNASNGRFTAPVNGTYFFFFAYAGDNGVAAPVMYFYVNGSANGPGASCYYTAYQGAYHGQLYTLTKDDYVNASARDWNGATPDPWNTYWGGWLLY